MIHRYDCLNCGWYADIPDEEQEKDLTEFCPECGYRLKNIGQVEEVMKVGA